jgi:hypothetical protein
MTPPVERAILALPDAIEALQSGHFITAPLASPTNHWPLQTFLNVSAALKLGCDLRG